MKCHKCRKSIPELTIHEDGWAAIERTLLNGSKTLAVAELTYYANCPKDEAHKFINHLLCCAHSWPTSKEDEKILKQIENTFANAIKPKHFTNYTHCDECNEHNQTLKKNSRETITRGDLGNCGWDPITFSNGEGFLYYFPILARFSLLPDVWDNDWYATQLLGHLAQDEKSNKLFMLANGNQKKAVAMLLKHIEATRARAICAYMIEDKLEKALAIWAIAEQSAPTDH